MNATEHRPTATRSARIVRACAHALLRHRVLPVALSLSLSAVAGYFALSLRVDNSAERWLPEDSSTRAGLHALKLAFGDQHLFQVVAQGDVFTSDYLEELRQLHNEISQLRLPPLHASAAQSAEPGDHFYDGFGAPKITGPNIERVSSLINEREPRSEQGALSFRRLLDPWPAADQLAALRERVLRSDSTVGNIVGSQGQYAIINATANIPEPDDEERVYRALQTLIDKHTKPGFKPTLAGISAFNAAQQIMTLQDILRLVIATSLSTFVLLLVLFRHPLGVVGPALVVGQSIVCTLGLMSACGVALTTVTSMLPAFLLVVGSGATIHMQTVYRDYRRAGVDNYAAIVQTLESTAIPVIMTEVTTALGLLSFLTATLGSIRELGLYGTLGLTISLCFSLTLVPIVLTFNKHSLFGAKPVSAAEDAGDGAHTASLVDRLVTWCSQVSRPQIGPNGARSFARRNRTLLAAGLLTLLTVVGTMQLKSAHNQLTWFPDDHPVRKTMELLESDVGGTSNFVLLINAQVEGGMSNLGLLQSLERFGAYVRAYRDPETHIALVSDTKSVVDLVQRASTTLYAQSELHAELPTTQRAASDVFTLLENSANDDLHRVVTMDRSQGVMLVRVRWGNAQIYGPLTDYLNAGAARYLGNYADVTVSGLSKGYFDVVAPILNDLMSSFATASFVVTVLIILILRDVKLGLVAMIPNMVPIGAMLGGMGVLGIPIDVSNMLIASVALGIVVDDTVHLLYQFRYRYAQTGRVEDAMEYALAHAGTGVAAMSLVLAVNFLLFGVAQMHNLQMVGVLLSATVAVAFLVELVLTPALLRWVYRDQALSEQTSATAVPAISAT